MTIDHPHLKPPDAGTALEVAPGVHWLRMPLPFALDHINLWLIEDGDGFTAVDTGIAMDGVKTAWKALLPGRHLRRQIVTHFHPDHLGLAAWLAAETGAPLLMTQGEYLTAQAIAAGIPPFDVASMVQLFRRHGLDDDRCAALDARGNAYRRGVPAIPATFQPLFDEDRLQIGAHGWQVIVGHGHAPEHASLYCADLNVMISGDMLLPRISTNVSSYAAAPELDTLGLYLASLEHLTSLPEDTLVLPSHGLPFRGLHARVTELGEHHAARCADLLTACAKAPRAAGELLEVLFGRPICDPHQTMFAMGEAIAHLNHLEHQNRLQRQDDGRIIRFTTAHNKE
ncbi:MBL fold metallo-hydrolase [Sulfuricystis multivorans]|uniref:MBL fold metallo-hydrolase n=1 Tax=Sulfuricystis multivorans TaxID=2211108 RepID=UPI000F828CA0|nr:MBL fold metallo-hydrolase [Sulfuricystis multivorans]